MSEKKEFTRVKGPFSQTKYIPRAGKIRLGLKVQSSTSGNTYPKNVDFFVCPEEVTKEYGAEPTELEIMFPTEDENAFFPQRLEWWKAGGLACHGDGEVAQRWSPEQKTWIDRTCPCEHFKDDANPKGECSERAHLLVLLPRVKMGSCYQIDTGSYHGVVNLNSMIANVRRLVGRVSYVPLLLRRVVREILRQGKREKKAILELLIDPAYDTPEGINTIREQTRRILESRDRVRLERPHEEPPTEGPVDVIEEDAPVSHVEHSASTSPGEPAPEAPTLTLGMNPDGAERMRQAQLTELPPREEPEPLLADFPPAPEPAPKPLPKGAEGDRIWQQWHNGAIQDAALYERTCRKLNIPMGKPINRAMRAAFRQTYDELFRASA